MDFNFPKRWEELEEIVNSGVLNELSVEYKRSSQLIQIYAHDRQTTSKAQALAQIYSEIDAARVFLPTGELVALTYNKYPYDLLLKYLPGVSHALLWFKGSLSTERAKAYLQGLRRPFCLYENPVALKSIPEINHYQIFLMGRVEFMQFPIVA